MREIKFRGYSDKKKKFVYGHYVVVDNFGHKQDGIITDYLKFQVTYVAHDSVGQFTGLKDKNGKEIYESDILSFEDASACNSQCGLDYDEYINNGVVIWDEDGLRWNVTNRSIVDLDCVWEDCEVIGNIHENPELLDSTTN